MHFKNGSKYVGTQLAAIGLIVAASFASAETIFTINGTAVDSAVVDVYFAGRLGNPEAQPTPEQRTAFIAELRDIYLLSTQDLAGELLKDPKLAARIELQRLRTVAQAVAADFYQNATVSEEDILAAYQELVSQSPPLQFKARHILVTSQGEAVDLITQLDGGADFIELAKANSTGPSASNGGDLDWFSPDRMVPEFSAAVSALEDGGYSAAPVQTQFGWHIILREESRESTPPTFESVRDEMNQRVQQKKFEAHLAILRASAEE